jgi:DNA modification methylase
VKPYHADDALTLYHGSAPVVLAELEPGSVDCVVTSPPYFSLRDYGVEGQHGIEDSPAEYAATMRQVFAEVRRVLAADGTLWLNLGDSYYSGKGNPGPNADDEKQPARRGWVRPVDRPGQRWGVPKSLLGIPWRVAFALQDDGWILRNAIVWRKTNHMPLGNTKDRLANGYEFVFLFVKSRFYWFDAAAIGTPHAESTVVAARRVHKAYTAPGQRTQHKTTLMAESGIAHPNDVWDLPTQPFPQAHFAVMPPALAERCVLAGCKPGGTVLDPYSGSGTTGLAAARHGRRYVGIDLNRDYLDLSLRTRLAQTALLDLPVFPKEA